MSKKRPSKKKMTKRASTKGPGHSFGKLRVPRNVRVRDSGVVDGDNPEYNPERDDYEAWGEEEDGT